MTSDIEDYIEAHISPQPVYLRDVERITNLNYLNGRMCSGHIQGRLLKMLVAMAKPKRVLELGTFTGYSALCIAEGLDDDGTIDTIESNDEMEEVILSNFSKSPYIDKIRLHIGNALDLLDLWHGNEFDMALIDADKREYDLYFEKVLKLIKPGGFILADNTLWDGHVMEQSKHSPQTQGIMKFNDEVMKCLQVEVAIIPIRDGLTIIRKKN
ncbi:MAG: O-methyltransferase [Muribaculaceae bacterium]|nr:O-methyltransferase [Muribaculaceae bacterium]